MLRLLLALPLGLLFAAVLFALMAAMVTPVSPPVQPDDNFFALDIFMTEPESELVRRDRVLPPRPEPLPAPELSAPALEAVSLDTPTIEAVLPDVALSLPVTDMAVAVPAMALPSMSASVGDLNPVSSTLGEGHQSAIPQMRVEPTYPAQAIKRGIEGFVVIRFTIDEQGEPTDLEVMEATPRRMFEREAMRALKKWRYSPKLVDGKPVAQPGQTVKLEFALAK